MLFQKQIDQLAHLAVSNKFMPREQGLKNDGPKGDPKGTSIVDTLLSMRYAALTVGGATLAAFLYYRQYAAPHASDEDKYDKSRLVNAKSDVMGAQDGKINSVKDSVSMVKEQNKIMNSKLSMIFLKASKAAKEAYRKKAYKGVSDAILSLPYAIGSPNSPTGLQMGTKGKHKVPSIGISSGNKIDEYLKTGRIKVFEAEYGIGFDGPDVEDVAIVKEKEKRNHLRRLKYQKGMGEKIFPVDGMIVDLETSIPRKGALHSIFEIGAITTMKVENTVGETFNCMVDFDLEKVPVKSHEDIEKRLEDLGQDAKFTLKFWKQHVLTPKFGWNNRKVFAEKIMESRANWAKVIERYGNGTEAKIPMTYEVMSKIKEEYGSYFFFPQSYALKTFLNYTMRVQRYISNYNNKNDNNLYWYAHNGNSFDFSVLEKSCWRLKIGLDVNRKIIVKPETPKESLKADDALWKLHNIKVYRKNPAGLNIVGFDTLLFARLKVGKGWATSNKRAGHSQESLYARYTSKYPNLAAQPADDGALETYDAHNAVDDCRALLKLMKAIDEYLGSS